MTTQPPALDVNLTLDQGEAYEYYGSYQEALDRARSALRAMPADAAPQTRSRARRAVARCQVLLRASRAADEARCAAYCAAERHAISGERL